MRRLCSVWMIALAIALATFMAACQQQPQQPQASPDTRAADEASVRNSDQNVEKTNKPRTQASFVIRGAVLDAKGLPQGGEITLFRKTSAPKGMPFGGVAAPWQDADAPDNLFLEIEGELKDRAFNVLNPKAETDGKGRFTLEVKPSFIGDAKDCTLTVGISRPRGGIVPQKIPRSRGAPLVFECPSRAAPELDLGELRLE